jgi:8-oxo-dGTP pyrophosphatase MutT (NUDIX family)
MTTNASGCVFIAKDTQRMCLQLRSQSVSFPGTWSFWGGKSEGDERPFETLLREVEEEIGFVPFIVKTYPLHKFTSRDKNFVYNAFVVAVESEFVPKTNGETAGYAWVNIDSYPKPLHRGAKFVLHNKDMIVKLKTIVDTV